MFLQCKEGYFLFSIVLQNGFYNISYLKQAYAQTRNDNRPPFWQLVINKSLRGSMYYRRCWHYGRHKTHSYLGKSSSTAKTPNRSAMIIQGTIY